MLKSNGDICTRYVVRPLDSTIFAIKFVPLCFESANMPYGITHFGLVEVCVCSSFCSYQIKFGVLS